MHTHSAPVVLIDERSVSRYLIFFDVELNEQTIGRHSERIV
jgi:hypothetical protein